MAQANQQAERIIFDAEISSAQSNLAKLRTELNLIVAAAAKTNAALSRINLSGMFGGAGASGKGLSGMAGGVNASKTFAAAQNAATMSTNRLTTAMRAGVGTAGAYSRALAGAAASAGLLSGSRIGQTINTARAPMRGAKAESDGLRSSFSGVGLAATGAAVAVLGFATKLTGIIRESSEAASNMQQLNTVFGVLLQSQSKGSALLEEVTQFAAATPMKVPELANATRVLLAYGESSTTVMSTLRRLGDIAAGTGQRIDEIATLIGKARQAGRLYGDDLNRLNDRGIPLTATLAKNLGITSMEVRKLVEQGRVGFSALEDAINEVTNEGGLFYGMLEKQSKNYGGVMSTLEDNITLAKKAFGAPINNALTPILQDAIEMLKEMKPQFTELGEAMAPVVASLVTAFKDLVVWIGENGKQVLDLVQTYGPLVAKALALAAAVKAAQMVFGALGAIIRGITGTLSGFTSIITTAASAVINLGSTLDRLAAKYATAGVAARTAGAQIAASSAMMGAASAGAASAGAASAGAAAAGAGRAGGVAGAGIAAAGAAAPAIGSAVRGLSTGSKVWSVVKGVGGKLGGILGLLTALDVLGKVSDGLFSGDAPLSWGAKLNYGIAGALGLASFIPKIGWITGPLGEWFASRGDDIKEADTAKYMQSQYSQALKSAPGKGLKNVYRKQLLNLFQSEESGTRGDRTVSSVQEELRQEISRQTAILDKQLRDNTAISDGQKALLKRRLKYLRSIDDATISRWTEQLLDETKNAAGRAKYDAAIAAEQEAARRANEERRAAERYDQVKNNRAKLQEAEIRYASGIDQQMFWWRRRRTALQEAQPDVQALLTGPDTGAYMTEKLGADFRIRGTEDIKKVLDAAGESEDTVIFASENVLNLQKAYEKILDYEKEEKKLRDSKQEYNRQEEERTRSLNVLKQKLYLDQAYAAGLINAEQRTQYEDQLKAIDAAKSFMDAGMDREEAMQMGVASVKAERGAAKQAATDNAAGQAAIDNAAETYKSAATGTLARQGWVDVISLGWRKDSAGAYLDPNRYDEQTTGPYQDEDTDLLKKINDTLDAIQANTNPDLKKSSVVWG